MVHLTKNVRSSMGSEGMVHLRKHVRSRIGSEGWYT